MASLSNNVLGRFLHRLSRRRLACKSGEKKRSKGRKTIIDTVKKSRVFRTYISRLNGLTLLLFRMTSLLASRDRKRGRGEEGRKTSNDFEHFSAVWSVDRHLGRGGGARVRPPLGVGLKKRRDTHTNSETFWRVEKIQSVCCFSLPSCVCLFVILVCPTNY